MLNIKVLDLLDGLRMRPKHKETYIPKFSANDLIICRYNENVYISKILDILRDENDLSCDQAHYSMYTLYNNGQIKQKLHSRTSLIHKIDASYELINANTARILYGIDLKGLK